MVDKQTASGYPPTWRVALAFTLTPALSGSSFWLVVYGFDRMRQASPALPAFVVGAYLASIVLGIPAYFWLRKQVRFGLISTTVIGMVLALVLAGVANGHLIIQLAVTGAPTGLMFWVIATAPSFRVTRL